MKRQTMNTRPFSLPIWAQALLAGAAFAAYASQAAYADSLEERLRTQLRSTTQQLQALQTEQAQATAAKAALESQRDAALAQVKQLSAELARARPGRAARPSNRACTTGRGRWSRRATSNWASTSRPTTSCWSWREQGGRAAEARPGVPRARPAVAAVHREEPGNVWRGQEILGAYENVSVAEVMKIRQPFASGARVKFEEMAQKLGDDLYKTQVENRQAALAQ